VSRLGDEVEYLEDEVYRLGEESGFFSKKDDLTVSELGEFKRKYHYGLETWIEVYENGCIVYHNGNKKIYRDREEAFRTVKILAQREKHLRRMLG